MRILCGLLLLLVHSGAYCDEKQILVPVHGSPNVSVLIMDTPVEDFEITREGLVTWNTWVNSEPSKDPQAYQHGSPEYEQTLSLIIKVFEKNYMPQSGINPNEPRVIYVIRIGEYFSSLALHLEYRKNQPIPNELRELMKYINGLRQSNKSAQTDALARAPGFQRYMQ